MALTTCKDCNKDFSTDAKRCLHCGALKPTDWSWLLKCTGVIFGFLLLIAALAPREGYKKAEAAEPQTAHTYSIKKLAILCGTEELLEQIYRAADDQREFEYLLHHGCNAAGQDIKGVSILERGALKDKVAIYLPNGEQMEVWVTSENVIEQ